VSRFQFENSGDDVWILLECGHYVRELEGVKHEDHTCSMCMNPKPLSLWDALEKQAVSLSPAEKKKKRLESREKREVKEALKKVEVKPPKAKGFWWRGKFRREK